jgi:putative hydrolase of the HAD superfamily
VDRSRVERIALGDERRRPEEDPRRDNGEGRHHPAAPTPVASQRHGAAEYSHGASTDPAARARPSLTPSAVLLDAYGTLVELEPPVPRLSAALGEAGYACPEPVVAEALRAEILYYRANHDDGRDAASLADLHRRCAGVLGEHLGACAPPPSLLVELLLASLRFALIPDALPALDALRAAGYRLAVASNWDCSLPAELARLGVADRFEAVAASAIVGARKPSPALFHHALERLGVDREATVHCGDHPEYDCLGARQAGLRAVLVDRAGRNAEAACPRIGALTELPAYLASVA